MAFVLTHKLNLSILTPSKSNFLSKIMNDLSNHKLDLDYPCEWEYKVIGKNVEDMYAAIRSTVGEECTICPSKKSTAKKYYSLNVTLIVEDETARNSLYIALKKHSAITMVM